MQELRSMFDLLKASLLYLEHQEQRAEVERHKWFESEKAGRDIGYDLAWIDWSLKHRGAWFKDWRRKHTVLCPADPSVPGI